eukprot:1533872-Rhodomonas_salina.1
MEPPVKQPRSPAELHQRADVLIVGAGIAGLALALALQQGGVPCVVFERDAAFASRKQGYALTIQQGCKALHSLGVLEEVAAEDVPCGAHYSFHSNGTLLSVFGPQLRDERWEKGRESGGKLRRNLHLPRQKLREILLSRLVEGTVRWRKRVMSVEGVEGGRRAGLTRIRWQEVSVETEEGEVWGAKLLVGADGINSVVRKAVVGEEEEDQKQYLEVMLVLGIARGVRSELLEGGGGGRR